MALNVLYSPINCTYNIYFRKRNYQYKINKEKMSEEIIVQHQWEIE